MSWRISSPEELDIRAVSEAVAQVGADPMTAGSESSTALGSSTLSGSPPRALSRSSSVPRGPHLGGRDRRCTRGNCLSHQRRDNWYEDHLQKHGVQPDPDPSIRLRCGLYQMLAATGQRSRLRNLQLDVKLDYRRGKGERKVDLSGC